MCSLCCFGFSLCLCNLQIVALWASSSCLRSFPKHPLCSQKLRLSHDVIFVLSFSLIISSSFPCFDSFCVFIFLLVSFFIISSLLWFCWATPHHVLSLLSLGLVTEISACRNLKYEMLMHEIHPHPLAGAGLLLLGRHVWCIWNIAWEDDTVAYLSMDRKLEGSRQNPQLLG